MNHLKTIFLATASVALLVSISPAFATTTTTHDDVIDDSTLAVGYPGYTSTSGSYYSERDQAVESDGSGAQLYVNGEGDITMDVWGDTACTTCTSSVYLDHSRVSILTSGGTTIQDTTGGLSVYGGETVNDGFTVNGNSQLNGDLTVTGNVNFTGSNAATFANGATVSNGLSVSGGLNNHNGGITNVGALSGVTTITTSGLATLDSASITHNETVGGTLGVTGLATLSGGVSTTTLTASGLVTANNGLTVNGSTLTANHNANLISTDTTKSLVVDNTSVRMVDTTGGNVTLNATGVSANGLGATEVLSGATASLANSYTRGLGVNATTTTLTGGGSGGTASAVTLTAATASVLTAGGNGLSATNAGAVTVKGGPTANSGLTIAANGTDVSLVNSNGHSGMTVDATKTVISGGTTSTDLTLNDYGATFGNHATGAPVQVTGVADGTHPFDAVNFEQLSLLEKKLNAGVAMGAALAGMPQVDESKKFGIALGGGFYKSQSAGAVGVSFRPRSDVVMKLGVGYSTYGTSVGGGVGFSW